MLEFDFQRHLHVELAPALRTHSWRWFANHVAGLLSLQDYIATPAGVKPIPGSLIAARFTRTEDDDG